MNRPQPNRKNMPNDFKLTSRDDIKPFYDKFLSLPADEEGQNISSLNELEEFIFSVDEIDKYM
jgi:hypothetical protein